MNVIVLDETLLLKYGRKMLDQCWNGYVERSVRKMIMSDFMVSLNHDFIRLRGCLLSLIMTNRINSMCIEPNLALNNGALG